MFDNENGFVRNAFYVRAEENGFVRNAFYVQAEEMEEEKEPKNYNLSVFPRSNQTVFECQLNLNKKEEIEIELIEVEYILK